MFQTQFPRPPSETLPTMYDLPSEDPEEPGLPDEFHYSQPKFLQETCQPLNYTAADFFIGIDLNLYYDLRHTQWYKRPDWFISLGVASADRQEDLRWSYVTWQEGVNPLLVVELLSPGTEDEDLGNKVRELGKPPTKWEVYERILRVPFYVVYDRYENYLQVFKLSGVRYEEIQLDRDHPKFWIDELGLGLGIWQGRYQGAEGRWIRWYDAQDQWIPTEVEAKQVAQIQTEAERSARRDAESLAEAERSARRDAESLAEAERSSRIQAESKLTAAVPQLLGLGLTVEQVANSLGLTIEEVEQAQ
jgi:Uma2 family endonuclease